MNKRPFSQQKENIEGFTFIEVLISIVIFSTGLLAVASMQLSSTSGNSSARQLGETSAIATTVIENILNTPYDDIVATTPSPDEDGIDNDGDGVTDESGETADRYSIAWDVTEDSLFNETKTVVVTVRDNSRTYRGRWRSLTIQTVVSRI